MGHGRILKISFLFLFLLSFPAVRGAIIFDGDINTFTRQGGGLLTFDQGILADRVIFEDNLANFYNFTMDSYWELVGFDVPANVTMLVTLVNNNSIQFDANPVGTVLARVNVGTKGIPLAVLGVDSWAWIPANNTVNMNITNILNVQLWWNVIPSGFCDYVATEFQNVTGFIIDGTLSDTWVHDGHHFTLGEDLGAPGFDYIFNITDIEDVCMLNGLVIVERYTGNVGHNVTFSVWNYTGGNWQIFDQVVDSPVFVTHNFNITGMNGDIIQNGTMSLRFYHVSPGNPFHTLEIDYIFLSNLFVPVVIGLEPWDINWLLALLWLGLTAIAVGTDTKIMMVFGGIFGVILGLLLLVIEPMVAIALICLNLYLIYSGAE